MIRGRRITLVITDLQVGGVPLHLFRLAKFLDARGWTVDVVSIRSGGKVADLLRAAGISVHSCSASGSFDWRVFDRLARSFSELRPDLVHSFLFHANLASRFACCLSGITRKRLVCEIQTVEIERRWHLLVDRITHRLCAVTVGNSDSVVQHLHRRAGIAMRRLTVIPGGIDVDAFAEAEPIQGES
ncbi:MAG: glycosyltransferase, partial [Planctomycetes bacterium]|nr:glycosyltransferase [Planctomycetota bacterium]